MAPGAIVKQIRSSAGLSQRSFAESIGICQSAVGYYESGKHRVSDVIWEKIKSVYHDVIVQLAIPEEMPDEEKKDLPPQSEELRRIRLASGLSQREFAESIGVSKSTIGNCEIGMQGINDQIAERAGAVWTYSKNAGKPMSKPRKTGGETGQESRISVSMKSIRTGTESFTTRSMDAFGKRREQAGPCTDSAIQQRTRRCRHV